MYDRKSVTGPYGCPRIITWGLGAWTTPPRTHSLISGQALSPHRAGSCAALLRGLCFFDIFKGNAQHACRTLSRIRYV